MGLGLIDNGGVFDRVFLGFYGARIFQLDQQWLCGFDWVVLGFRGARYFLLDWRCGMGLIRFFWVFGAGFDQQWWCGFERVFLGFRG